MNARDGWTRLTSISGSFLVPKLIVISRQPPYGIIPVVSESIASRFPRTFRPLCDDGRINIASEPELEPTPIANLELSVVRPAMFRTSLTTSMLIHKRVRIYKDPLPMLSPERQHP